jgi:hypothetical protein
MAVERTAREVEKFIRKYENRPAFDQTWKQRDMNMKFLKSCALSVIDLCERTL